ncbi:MAG: hypothetical protein DRQ65_03225 [Gammaproteobacteria bacterium]|nr:MAG: hypothetical protein DRQ65_03225 [Gammaproteobacteria bacterium]RLA56664.1 MAG: hypothetical protein DRQ98_01300 [Gammaproteobacteria bacterium]HDY83612.1 hypothetical protein [Halieaceae bacterium]
MLYQGDNPAMRRLSIVLVVLGVSFFALPIIVELLPSLFRWSNPAVNMADEHMIVAMYYALGICWIMAAKDPLRHAIIIDYTIIANALHGAVMFYYAIVLEGEMAHLWGDVPMLFALSIGFAIYHPRRLARANA